MMLRILKALVVVGVGFVAFRMGFGTASDPTVSDDPVPVFPEVVDAAAGMDVSPNERARRRRTLELIADSDTYVPAFLVEYDSLIRRWRDRVADPLRVYFERSDFFTQDYGQAVWDAFRRWQRASGVPVRFELVRDRARAEVRVVWIGSFGARRAGQAETTYQSDGWVQSGTLTLATRGPRGGRYTTDAMFTVALHEIGHLLGLGHSDDPRDVMAPETGVHDLTQRDRRTAMFLYSLTPGPLRGT